MQWIRDNRFLACLIGIVIVVGGVMAAVGVIQNKGFSEDMKPRQDLARRLRGLGEVSLSPEMLARKKQQLEAKRQTRDRVLRDSVAWNQKDYPVLQLALIDDGRLKMVPAFPIDATLYRDKGLTYVFTDEYRKVLYGYLGELKPTTAPTEEEIAAGMTKWVNRIGERKKIAVNRVRSARRMGADSDDRTRPAGITDEEWVLFQMTDERVRERAVERAIEELTVSKARAGLIYASPASLDVVFPRPEAREADAPPDLRWGAQVNLWVSRDILEAINKTNLRALRRGALIRSAIVPNAAVKQLVKIEVQEGYVDVEPGTPGRRSRDVPTPGYEAGMGGVERRGRPAGRGRATGRDKSLTGRVTNREYQIVRYRFTVILNTGRLLDLLRNVMLRGDHTVLNVEMAEPSIEEADMRYYGVEAVMRATITGEMLMRSAWTRPLMPAEVLRKLPVAMGDKDKKRLAAKAR